MRFYSFFLFYFNCLLGRIWLCSGLILTLHFNHSWWFSRAGTAWAVRAQAQVGCTQGIHCTHSTITPIPIPTYLKRHTVSGILIPFLRGINSLSQVILDSPRKAHFPSPFPLATVAVTRSHTYFLRAQRELLKSCASITHLGAVLPANVLTHPLSACTHLTVHQDCVNTLAALEAESRVPRPCSRHLSSNWVQECSQPHTCKEGLFATLAEFFCF